MTDVVWWVSATGMPDDRVTFAISNPDLPLKARVEIYSNAQYRGETLPDDLFPRRLTNKIALPVKKRIGPNGHRLPYFFSHNLHCVSNEAIDVFERHDLGEAQFRPVAFFEHGDQEQVDEPVRVLVPANPRTALLVEQSPKLAANALAWSPGQPVMASYLYEDDDVAVSSAVLGGPDVWIDPMFTRTFFLSDALVQALKAEGLDADFGLRRARIL